MNSKVGGGGKFIFGGGIGIPPFPIITGGNGTAFYFGGEFGFFKGGGWHF